MHLDSVCTSTQDAFMTISFSRRIPNLLPRPIVRVNLATAPKTAFFTGLAKTFPFPTALLGAGGVIRTSKHSKRVLAYFALSNFLVAFAPSISQVAFGRTVETAFSALFFIKFFSAFFAQLVFTSLGAGWRTFFALIPRRAINRISTLIRAITNAFMTVKRAITRFAISGYFFAHRCILPQSSRECKYVTIARHRLEHWQDEASIEPRKIKGKDKDFDDMPLFAEVNS